MVLTLEQIKELIETGHIKQRFLSSVKNNLQDKSINLSSLEIFSKSQFDDLYDAFFEALINDTKVRNSYRVVQDKGEYLIQVRGFACAQFIQSPEYDEVGFFNTPDEADKYIEINFGEFLLDETDKEFCEKINQELWDTLEKTTKDLPMRNKLAHYQYTALKMEEHIEKKNGNLS